MARRRTDRARTKPTAPASANVQQLLGILARVSRRIVDDEERTRFQDSPKADRKA